jgi:spore germination cell wall hydrolase CwlJ-like protein
MDVQPYQELSDLEILALCCYREARGEPMAGKRGVCHVIKNRTLKPGWWGHDYKSVILKPWQFSSFNTSDPNSDVWPKDIEKAWLECMDAASAVLVGDDPDTTDGALYYHDTSITFPKAWGLENAFVNTLNVGRLKFYRPV